MNFLMLSQADSRGQRTTGTAYTTVLWLEECSWKQVTERGTGLPSGTSEMAVPTHVRAGNEKGELGKVGAHGGWFGSCYGC